MNSTTNATQYNGAVQTNRPMEPDSAGPTAPVTAPATPPIVDPDLPPSFGATTLSTSALQIEAPRIDGVRVQAATAAVEVGSIGQAQRALQALEDQWRRLSHELGDSTSCEHFMGIRDSAQRAMDAATTEAERAQHQRTRDQAQSDINQRCPNGWRSSRVVDGELRQVRASIERLRQQYPQFNDVPPLAEWAGVATSAVISAVLGALSQMRRLLPNPV